MDLNLDRWIHPSRNARRSLPLAPFAFGWGPNELDDLRMGIAIPFVPSSGTSDSAGVLYQPPGWELIANVSIWRRGPILRGLSEASLAEFASHSQSQLLNKRRLMIKHTHHFATNSMLLAVPRWLYDVGWISPTKLTFAPAPHRLRRGRSNSKRGSGGSSVNGSTPRGAAEERVLCLGPPAGVFDVVTRRETDGPRFRGF